MAARDVLGRELTEVEAQLLEAYERVRALLDLELAPCAAANVRESVAALWIAANELGLVEDRPEV